ncbi:hypothetical protein BV902_17415 [Sphingobacterium sp. B29]|nr:hypothetical protein BV902_17415 [Sphingobacterium sp. B29]
MTIRAILIICIKIITYIRLIKKFCLTLNGIASFFLIATDHKKMDKFIASHLFEGFLWNDKTNHYWEYTVE